MSGTKSAFVERETKEQITQELGRLLGEDGGVDVLTDYVYHMVINPQLTTQHLIKELQEFLSNDTATFASWLGEEVIPKLGRQREEFDRESKKKAPPSSPPAEERRHRMLDMAVRSATTQEPMDDRRRLDKRSPIVEDRRPEGGWRGGRRRRDRSRSRERGRDRLDSMGGPPNNRPRSPPPMGMQRPEVQRPDIFFAPPPFPAAPPAPPPAMYKDAGMPPLPHQLASFVGMPFPGALGAVPPPSLQSTYKVRRRCQNYPDCRLGDGCRFIHPTEMCKTWPSCTFGRECFFIHPDTACKFGINCFNAACNYAHPADWQPRPPPRRPPPHKAMGSQFFRNKSLHIADPQDLAAEQPSEAFDSQVAELSAAVPGTPPQMVGSPTSM